MIDLSCPKCGRGGSIPREKLNTRLVCKKCRSVFHVNTAGRAVPGEPKVDHAADENHSHAANTLSRGPSLGDIDWKATLPQVSGRALLIGAVVLGIGAGAWIYLSQAPESLESKTAETAKRFAEDDLAYLKQVASSDTVDDAIRWFDAVHPKLVKSRAEWKTKSTEVRVMVIDEDRRRRQGESQAFVYPTQGAARAASIADAASAASSNAPVTLQPVELDLHWVLDGGGRWRLNGLQTFRMAGGTP